MYGSNTGTLNLIVRGTNGKESVVWSRAGNMGDQWKKLEVSLPSQSIDRVREDKSVCPHLFSGENLGNFLRDQSGSEVICRCCYCCCCDVSLLLLLLW